MKICTKCGEEKELDKFRISQDIRKDGTRGCMARCKKCDSKYNKEWAGKNKVRRNIYNKKWNKENANHIKRYRDKYDAKYYDDRREYSRQYGRTQKENLGDSHIKKLLTQHSTLSRNDIPKSMVEVKRLQVLIHREITNRQGV